jgi:hypothetical protein
MEPLVRLLSLNCQRISEIIEAPTKKDWLPQLPLAYRAQAVQSFDLAESARLRVICPSLP